MPRLGERPPPHTLPRTGTPASPPRPSHPQPRPPGRGEAGGEPRSWCSVSLRILVIKLVDRLHNMRTLGHGLRRARKAEDVADLRAARRGVGISIGWSRAPRSASRSPRRCGDRRGFATTASPSVAGLMTELEEVVRAALPDGNVELRLVELHRTAWLRATRRTEWRGTARGGDGKVAAATEGGGGERRGRRSAGV